MQLDYLDWVAKQVGLEGMDEGFRSTVKSYMKFLLEHGHWRHKEWEPCNGIEEADETSLGMLIERVNLSST